MSKFQIKKESRKIDLLMAFVINVVFLIIYTCIFNPIHETNDDLAISFMLEGAYGEYTPYVVYQNVLWGKFMVALNMLLPQFKNYMIIMYGMLFVNFLGVTYTFLRTQGRKWGSVISTAILLFCGYQSYVIFQYSRVAAVVAAGGLLLLFYALEHAGCKKEKWIMIVLGGFLSLWASMIRFQMFAMSVVLVGGCIAIHRAWKIFREHKSEWLKRLLPYVAVFGTVGVLSLGLYVVDRVHYSSDEGWAAYTEFNEVRTELWDYGFPAYNDHAAFYNEMGISLTDFYYYYTWNMDEEVMTTEYLSQIAAAKPAKTFSVIEYFSLFPKDFLTISPFVLYLVLAVVAIAINWKNIYFAAYGFAGVMAFEAYFFYIGRCSIERVDCGMWMVACMALAYAVADDVKAIVVHTWRYAVAAIAVTGLLFAGDLVRTDAEVDGVVGSTKELYQTIREDKEHMYIVMSFAPRIYYAYDFWEPCVQGDFSNVYNAYGWEFNVPVKQAIREAYGIENIYRDSIDNETVYFVADTQQDVLQLYIQENYNPNAVVVYEKEIAGVPIWSVRTVESVQ